MQDDQFIHEYSNQQPSDSDIKFTQQLPRDNQPPMGGNRPPMGGNQPPMGGGRPPMGGNQPPMGGGRPPMGGNQPPIGGRPPFNPPPPPFTPPPFNPPGEDGQQPPAPRSAPPTFTPSIPQRQDGARGIRNCLYRNTFIWLNNGNSFWFFPTFVGRQAVAGFRWRGFGWTFQRINLERIRSFQCF